MDEPAFRQLGQIRQECAAKLRRAETNRDIRAILGCLLGESWTDPQIVELRLTADRCVIGRARGAVTFNHVIGARDDLIRNIHGLAKAAGLDGDEVGYLLGAVAKIKSVE